MQQSLDTPGARVDLRAGDVVEVRSAAEILATLDDRGEFESLPFMPEMLKFCGRRFTVDKVALKLCDTIGRTGFRRMTNAVHLRGARCDGQAHGGCQAGCLTYWKTAWLKRVESAGPPADPLVAPQPTRAGTAQLAAATQGEPAPDGAETYRCQATEILRAAPEPLPVRDLGQYAQDVRSGNVSAPWAIRAFLVALFNRVQDLSRRTLPRWLWFRNGLRWGFLRGEAASRTPTARTDLRPGELVRVKAKREIMPTVDEELRNRGLGFDVEMARFCGQVARVSHRVEKIIDEQTGRMRQMKHPCIVLEGLDGRDVVCEGAYSSNCPRSIHAYWREIWLERVDRA
jgi:hypothetical protein